MAKTLLREVHDILSEADEVIDGDMSCHTPEYRAADLLRTALWNLYREMEARATQAETEETSR